MLINKRIVTICVISDSKQALPTLRIGMYMDQGMIQRYFAIYVYKLTLSSGSKAGENNCPINNTGIAVPEWLAIEVWDLPNTFCCYERWTNMWASKFNHRGEENKYYVNLLWDCFYSLWGYVKCWLLVPWYLPLLFLIAFELSFSVNLCNMVLWRTPASSGGKESSKGMER